MGRSRNKLTQAPACTRQQSNAPKKAWEARQAKLWRILMRGCLQERCEPCEPIPHLHITQVTNHSMRCASKLHISNSKYARCAERSYLITTVSRNNKHMFTHWQHMSILLQIAKADNRHAKEKHQNVLSEDQDLATILKCHPP